MIVKCPITLHNRNHLVQKNDDGEPLKNIFETHEKFPEIQHFPSRIKNAKLRFLKKGGCEKKFLGMEFHHLQKFLAIKAHGWQRSDLGHR